MAIIPSSVLEKVVKELPESTKIINSGVRKNSPLELPNTTAIEDTVASKVASIQDMDVDLQKQLRTVWDEYDADGTITFDDLVEKIDEISIDSSNAEVSGRLQAAVKKYKAEQRDDFELGGRGDMDQAEAEFSSTLKTTGVYSVAGVAGVLGAPPEQKEEPAIRLANGTSFEEITKDTSIEEVSASVGGYLQDIINSGEFTEDEARQMIKDELNVPEEIVQGALSSMPINIPPLVPIAAEVQIKEETINTLYQASQTVHNRYIPFIGAILGPYVGMDASTQRQYMKDNVDISVSIANSLRNLGRNVDVIVGEDGTPMVVEIDKDGNPQEITEGFFKDTANSIANSGGEIVTGLAGGTAVAAAVLKALPATGLFGKLGVNIAAITAGSATSALTSMPGRGIDAAYFAWQTKQDLDVKHYSRIMTDAGLFNATFGILGGTAWKSTTTLAGIFKKFATGNKTGAYEALKNTYHVDDKQIDEIVAEWEKVTGETAPGYTRANKSLHVLPQTQAGGETIVGGAAKRSPEMSTAMRHTIDDRAKNLQQAAKNLTTDNIATVVTDDLVKYKKGVKDYYSGIKTLGTDSMQESSYRFDYDELAIEPVLNDIEKRITNPAVLERFQSMLQTVRDVGGTPAVKGMKGINAVPAKPSQLRTFSDLIELRRTINGFKYNTNISSALDFGSINKVIRNIDDEIEHVALKEMPNGKVWLNEWKKANIEYGNMLKLEENVLYKALTSDGVNHKKVVNAFKNNITALDGTFMRVMSRLPPATRTKVEGAVMDEIVTKYTSGAPSGLQAVNFPKLAEELKHIAFTDPKTRELKRSIGALAKVFKNDVDLSNVTGGISKTGSTSSIALDPRTKVKMEFVNQTFDYIRRIMPTEKANYIALEMHVAKLLKSPKDSKSIQAISKMLGDDPEMTSKIRQFSIQMTKFGESDKQPYVEVYRSGIPGKAHKAKAGSLGKGIYWTTDELKAKTRAMKTGGKQYKEDMLPTRIATQADVENVYGTSNITAEMYKDPLLVKALKDRGYDGLSLKDEVVVWQ